MLTDCLTFGSLGAELGKKRLDAEKSLAKNLEEKNVLEIDYAHKKENVSLKRQADCVS